MMVDDKKDESGRKGFCVSDVPPWVKETAVRKTIWAANELRDINNGPHGVEPGGDSETAHHTGHHADHVLDYHDPIRLSAAYVNSLTASNPRLAAIIHGSFAEPYKTIEGLDNPNYFGKRDLSAPQREKVKEAAYRIFDDYSRAGIIRLGPDKK